MQLVNFSYNDQLGQLEGVALQTVNLIVGKNASGKSQMLFHVEGLTEMLAEKLVIPWTGEWSIHLKTKKGEELNYYIERHVDEIIKESLSVDKKIIIDRDQNVAKVLSEKSGQLEEIEPPKNKLVIHIRRDRTAYPYFEEIIEWANSSYHFRFGSIISAIYVNDSRLTRSVASPINATDGESLAALFDDLEDSRIESIAEVMNSMEYDLTGLNTKSIAELIPDSSLGESSLKKGRILIVKEGENLIIREELLSQGTLRLFSLLLYVQNLLQYKKSQLICIDDLGEGLDYYRATKIGKYIFKLCEEEGIQLIITSNDGFIMDVIPIEYWNVLRRNGSKVTVLNIENQPELFERFAYTGLSNFDFFSSDYIDSRLK